MEQEIRRPDYVPRVNNRTSSTLNCFLAAAGLTTMTFCLVGSAAAISVWAIVKLFELPDIALYVALALVAVPVVWVTVWTAGRAWYLENRLSRGQDVDAPVYKMLYYFSQSH